MFSLYDLNNFKGQITERQEIITKINDKRGTLTLEKEKLEQESKDLDKQHEKICLLSEQKGYAQKRMENVPTNPDMISDNSGSTHYRRHTEDTSFVGRSMGLFEE